MVDTLGIDGPPRRMGRYELLFRIASGGMAEVYAARVLGEAGFEKLVAVKRMLPTLAEDDEFVQMFLDEARVAANISNPHVVQTLDLGRDETGALYIVMDLVIGVTLSRILKEAAKVRRAVPVGMAVELLAQAATGLHAAHEATTPIGEPLHIVHRDVSPQNILVGVDGRVRITDFGVARAVARMTQTQAGRIKGKFAYCSPEHLRNAAIDRRSDVFALGVVAWETFAGQRLFVADHPLAIMERVQNMPILPVSQVRTKVPDPVARVVDRALERDPDKRFSTAGAFGDALRHAAREAQVETPEQGQARRFVRGAGGAPLRKIRANIQRALRLGDDESMEVEATETLSHISQSGTGDTDLEGPELGRGSVEEADDSAIHSGPGSLMPPPFEPPPPAAETSSRRLFLIVTAGVAIALVVGVATFIALRQEPAAADAAPSAEAAPPLVRPTDPEPIAPPEPVPAAPEEGTGGAAPDAPEAELAEEAAREPDPEPASAPRRRSRRRAMASPVSPSAEARAPTPMRIETTMAPTEMETSSMGNLLLGLDDFDRAAGQ